MYERRATPLLDETLRTETYVPAAVRGNNHFDGAWFLLPAPHGTGASSTLFRFFLAHLLRSVASAADHSKYPSQLQPRQSPRLASFCQTYASTEVAVNSEGFVSTSPPRPCPGQGRDREADGRLPPW